MNSKAIKRQLLAAIAMVLVAAIALGSSTYAWFVQNNTVTATGFEGTASSASNLLISLTNNNDYATAVDMGITLNEFTPVSGGTDLIKAGTLYKVKTWSNEADLGNNQFNSTGKLATTYELAADGTDYAKKDIYLKSTAAQDIYFNDDTVITADKTVKVGNVTYHAIATLKASDGTVSTKVTDDNGVESSFNDATNPQPLAVTNAIGYVQSALGSLRITLVDVNDSNAVKFLHMSNSEAGYFNTATVDDETLDITTAQVIKAVDASTKKATALENDGAVNISTYTGTGNDFTTAPQGKTALCSLTADVPQHYIVYIYLEGCDKQCVTGITDNVTFKVNLGFSGIALTV